MSKKRLFSLLVMAGFLSLPVQNVFAETTDPSAAKVADTEKMLDQMQSQAAALEAQMQSLKKQIRELKAQQQSLEQEPHYHRGKRTRVLSETPGTIARIQEAPGLPPKSVVTTSPSLLNTYLSGTPVVIAPYIGDHTAFNASDLVINYSSYNEDLRLLQLRQGINNQYCQNGLTPPDQAELMLSGKVEGQGIYTKPSGQNSESRIDLTGAEIDFIPMLGQWASGFISLDYDNSKMPGAPLTSNSNVFVDQGFLTIGNLNRFPLYFTIGQLYVPFGMYSSNMISEPLTGLIFQAKERVAELGYEEKDGQGPYAQVYAFNGDADTGSADNVNDVGGNIGFNYANSNWNIDTGVGAIADVADALGMQTTSGISTALMPNFTGFSSTVSPFTMTTDILQHQVPGIAAHLNFGIGQFGVSSEYITATSDFSPLDMTFNGEGAKPQALNAEAYYNLQVFGKPSALSVGYGQSWQALALAVPEKRYIAAFTTSWWKDTIQEIEFRHDINYSTGDTASGAGIPVPASQTGGSTNTVTLQFGVYF